MILIIDNYDSFTYNLVQYIGEILEGREELLVFRNDRITLDEIKNLSPRAIIISPGPGRPKDAGISEDVIKEFGKNIPILGVCLGHQAIGEVFGGKIVYAERIMHGKTSEIFHNGGGIFENIENPFVATRYHSLILEPKSIPNCLEVSAKTKEGEIMGIRHREYPIFGLQFHPESILTLSGKNILKNFIDKI